MDKTVFRLLISNEAKLFISSQPKAVSDKIMYNIGRVIKGERNSELFKKLDNTDIWEFRTLYSGHAYRLFAFWDKEQETIVVVTHGIIKKSQKTPKQEIKRAEAIMKVYFEHKKR